MSPSASETPKLLLIGTAFLAGAVVLAWLSSPATMRVERVIRDSAPVERPRSEAPQSEQSEQAEREAAQLARTQAEPATVTIESWLFGLINLGRERIDGVRSATLIDSRMPGSNSHTPPHMVLETTAGSVNIGRAQQLFARDFSEIKSFFDDGVEPQLTLSSIARSSERTRFIVAQLVTLFLGFTGLGLLWLGIKSLWS